MKFSDALPPIAFNDLIEADHHYMMRLADQMLTPDLPYDHFFTIFRELIWRLVRHDVSEELVMRPAFVRHLGPDGVVMADHDRYEHSEIKEQLSAILNQLSSSAGSTCDQHIPEEFITRLRPLLVKMQQHMTVESGQQLPAFAAQIGAEESIELGREYAISLMLTPSNIAALARPTDTVNKQSEISMITDFLGEGIARFRQYLSDLVRRDPIGAINMIKNELNSLGFASLQFDTSKLPNLVKTRL